LVGCPDQVVQKKMPIDIISGSSLVSELFIDDKLVRHPAYTQGLALAGQLELLAEKPLDAWRLPYGVSVRRLERCETREHNPETGE
jgi:hypothetical protein